MLPALRADQIFPGTCDSYTAHLGEHQAEAFRMLWGLHDAPDPLTNADRAAWHLNRQLQTNDGIRIVQGQARDEIFQGLGRVEQGYPGSSTANDITYAGLFVAIADWQHEILAENITAFTNDLYQ